MILDFHYVQPQHRPAENGYIAFQKSVKCFNKCKYKTWLSEWQSSGCFLIV